MIDHITLQRFSDATQVPLQLFRKNSLIQNYSQNDFDPNPAVMIAHLAKDKPDRICYTMTPEYLYYGLVNIRNSSKYVIVGPTMSFKSTQRQAENILLSIQQPASRSSELLRWLRNIPTCNLKRFLQILNFLDYVLNETTEHHPIHIPYETKKISVSTIDHAIPYIKQSDLLEKKLLSYVEYGYTDVLKDTLNHLDSQQHGDLPVLSTDAVRSYQKLFVFATGLVSRAATKGGLDYNIALRMSEEYITKIDMYENNTDLWQFLKQMFLDFTQRTAESRLLRTDSLIVKKTSKVVQEHLYNKITPTTIAEHLKMNCSYLCRHFKQETGQTITEFITKVKITESKRLLETTDIPLVQISTKLGFSSQNYIHKVFKKVTEMTPMEYKNKT